MRSLTYLGTTSYWLAVTEAYKAWNLLFDRRSAGGCGGYPNLSSLRSGIVPAMMGIGLDWASRGGG